MPKRLTCLLMLGIAVSAEAGVEPRGGIGGGVALPLSAYAKDDGVGFHLGAALTLPTGAKGLRVRLDGLFSRTTHDVGGGVTRIVGGALGLSYHLRDEGAVSPYVMAGAGLHQVAVSSTVCLAGPGDGCGTNWDRETKPSLQGGAGIEGKRGRVRLFGEARIVVVNTKYAVSRSGRTPFVLITAGVSVGGRSRK